MSRTHLVIADNHAHYKEDNRRADWIGELINEVRPDVLIHIGDSADMPSLSSYDKGRRSFEGRNYTADIGAHLDFQDRMFYKIKRSKKKMPRTIFCIGNHEERISRALNLSPELDGAISYDDLGLEDWYDDIVHYEGNTPGCIAIDGVSYAHFFASGIMGRPISGEHPAYSLINKKHRSCVQGHSHVFDHCVRKLSKDRSIMCTVAPCLVDYTVDWAGQTQEYWSAGVLILNNVEDGSYDLETVSLSSLKREYNAR